MPRWRTVLVDLRQCARRSVRLLDEPTASDPTRPATWGHALVARVYSGDLKIPLDAFLAGLGDHTIRTTLCPDGKERMRRLMEVIASGRVDTRPLVTHRFRLDRIEEAYDLFANQRDGVLKVAITP
jgi:threonine dehydrogenase-like Zn-dependent dehydrogenase